MIDVRKSTVICINFVDYAIVFNLVKHVFFSYCGIFVGYTAVPNTCSTICCSRIWVNIYS
jgi:hypothetical protein